MDTRSSEERSSGMDHFLLNELSPNTTVKIRKPLGLHVLDKYYSSYFQGRPTYLGLARAKPGTNPRFSLCCVNKTSLTPFTFKLVNWTTPFTSSLRVLSCINLWVQVKISCRIPSHNYKKGSFHYEVTWMHTVLMGLWGVLPQNPLLWNALRLSLEWSHLRLRLKSVARQSRSSPNYDLT